VWRLWDGPFSAFCAFVRTDLAIDFGPTLIGHILSVETGRRCKRRPGRSPDEKAMRKDMLSFFPGAQWFEDGSPIDITVNGETFIFTFTFNCELVVDGFSGQRRTPSPLSRRSRTLSSPQKPRRSR
jgi:hypothetical protein